MADTTKTAAKPRKPASQKTAAEKTPPATPEGPGRVVATLANGTVRRDM